MSIPNGPVLADGGALPQEPASCRPASALAGARGPRILLCLIVTGWLGWALSQPLTFDDAYMFERYARHLGQGLGLSWNQDGVPTYGLTSQLWVFVVLPFTGLPLPSGAALQVASWFTGVAGLALVLLTVSHQAGTSPESARRASWGVLLLVLNPLFAYHLTTGMDTMLAFLANAGLVLALLDYGRRPSAVRSVAVGLVAFLAVLARPDSGLCAVGAPVLVWVLGAQPRRGRDLVGLLGVPAVLIGLDLGFCRWYFGVPLPLGFYAKSAGTYAGFQNAENPVRYMLVAVACALPFLAVLAVRADRWRALAPLLIPVVATLIYLGTVRQIMGWSGRYYIPLLPFVVVPALISADRALSRDGDAVLQSFARVLAVLTLALLVASVGWNRLEGAYLGRVLPPPVREPDLPILATRPLPHVDWSEAIARFVEDVAVRLPPGSTIAASEVGYLGAAAAQASIIDLVGLNDTRIARNGFSVDDLLDRAPDLIWLPNRDYTELRAQILGDARVQARYGIIVDAFDAGLAIRRDSRFRAEIDARVATAWAALYPGYRLDDYVIRAMPGR